MKKHFFLSSCLALFLPFPVIALLLTVNLSVVKAQSLEDIMRMANAFSESGLYDQALTEYGNLLKRLKPFPAVYNNMGLAYQGKGDLDKAEEYFRKALDLDPDFPDSLNNLGLLLIARKSFLDGIFYLRRAVNFRPDSFEYRDSLGTAYSGAGLYDMAIAQYRRALEIKEDGEEYRKLGRALGELGQWEEALLALRQGVKIAPGLLLAWLDIIDIHHKRGEPERAQVALDEIIRYIDREPPAKEIEEKLKEVFTDWYGAGLLGVARKFYAQDNVDWSPLTSDISYQELVGGNYLYMLNPDFGQALDLAKIVIDREGQPVSANFGPFPYGFRIAQELSQKRRQILEDICGKKRSALSAAWAATSIFANQPMLIFDQRDMVETGFLPWQLNCPNRGEYDGAADGITCTFHGFKGHGR